ncbi:LysM peptidoglycan-binding domain-containing protein [Verrucomicrobiaceae bacterium R5-34]|uniref:LysM peptidoglycan-binding domain-containing protein n=1 Tax=Oceaniferula flava TaxID=2800421 RepID=A0AAE2SBP2_9BACT|nr:LysM peptidoglycan-binding domain-containing protein [Oceaniferula flavus]MBK1830390.1 LysM peptidoglycan-binding domain-containing protein [Verrucomicrobiaceae bacterium R5-34]MBK1854482.1 LysM peptidoglycan-binding domain-containing protein [Oceaniferula flavus]MBM1135788.1 LysM peptidoglycan-binding domain-containing protein [Oceaniferula flavus]
MKYNTISPIAITALAAVATLSLSSCGLMDPDYKAWKESQQAQVTNPYGAPAAAANPYGVPQTAGEAGTYTPAGGSAAPYQPVPNVNLPANSPNPVAAIAPSVSNGSHEVVSGDSLWGLARKYGTSIEAIQAANNLTDTNIRTGQTLIIPGQ